MTIGFLYHEVVYRYVGSIHNGVYLERMFHVCAMLLQHLTWLIVKGLPFAQFAAFKSGLIFDTFNVVSQGTGFRSNRFGINWSGPCLACSLILQILSKW